MTGQDLIEQHMELVQAAREAIVDFRTEGVGASQADRTYRVEKAKQMARLKLQGVAASTTEALSYKNEVVADARCERNSCEARRDAAKEVVQLLKREIDFNKLLWERENR